MWSKENKTVMRIAKGIATRTPSTSNSQKLTSQCKSAEGVNAVSVNRLLKLMTHILQVDKSREEDNGK